MDSFDYMAHPYGVEFHGPFLPLHKVSVEGYRVPHLSATAVDGGWNIVCDERFGIHATDEEARKWLGFVAQCMAVAAGYSSHGEHSGIDNPFRHRMMRIGGIETGDE